MLIQRIWQYSIAAVVILGVSACAQTSRKAPEANSELAKRYNQAFQSLKGAEGPAIAKLRDLSQEQKDSVVALVRLGQLVGLSGTFDLPNTPPLTNGFAASLAQLSPIVVETPRLPGCLEQQKDYAAGMASCLGQSSVEVVDDDSSDDTSQRPQIVGVIWRGAEEQDFVLVRPINSVTFRPATEQECEMENASEAAAATQCLLDEINAFDGICSLFPIGCAPPF